MSAESERSQPAVPGGESQGLRDCLVFFIGVAPTAHEVLGILHQDTNVDIIGPPKEDFIDDRVWKKDKARIIRYTNGKPNEEKERYQVFKNGTLKIKHLQRNDSGSYEVNLYNSKGQNILMQTFHLKILGKSLFPKFFCLNMGAL